MAYSAAVRGGNNTVTCTGPSGDSVSVWAQEISGAGALDTDAYATSSSGSSVNTPSVTPGQSGEALLSAAFVGGSVTAAGGSWTLGTVSGQGAVETQIAPNTSTVAANFTESGSGWQAITASFKPAIVPPAQASSAGFSTLQFDDEFTSLNIAPTKSNTGTYNWYPGIWFDYWTPSSSRITDSSGVLGLDWALSDYQANDHVCNTTISGESSSGTVGHTFRYGYFEARMKWDYNSSGSFPAFWMEPVQAVNGASNFGEIDIFEGNAGDPHYYGTLHTWNGSTKLWVSSPNKFNVPSGTDFTQWHTYGALWTPGSGSTPGTITWYFDNVAVASSPTTPSNNSLFDQQDYFLMLTSQEGTLTSGCSTTNGPPNGTAANLNVNVDWVRVWQN